MGEKNDKNFSDKTIFRGNGKKDRKLKKKTIPSIRLLFKKWKCGVVNGLIEK